MLIFLGPYVIEQLYSIEVSMCVCVCSVCVSSLIFMSHEPKLIIYSTRHTATFN